MTLDLRARLERCVIPAAPVPFRADGSIDRDSHRTYVEWMAHQSMGGVAVWAHTGRGLRLSAEERAWVLDAWCQGLRDVPVICGVGVEGSATLPREARALTDTVISSTVDMACAAKRGGARGLLVHPPTALSGLADADSRIVALHAALTDVGLPIIAFYLYEAAGGVSYGSGVVEKLLALEGVIGIKVATLDSVMTFQELAPIVQQSSALLITGEDRFLGYSLMLGATCALVGIAAACTDVTVGLLDAWFKRDLATFVRRSHQLDVFAAATFVPPMEGYVQRMLWALTADGVIPPALDRHAPPLPAAEHDRVRAAVQRLRAK